MVVISVGDDFGNDHTGVVFDHGSELALVVDADRFAQGCRAVGLKQLDFEAVTREHRAGHELASDGTRDIGLSGLSGCAVT